MCTRWAHFAICGATVSLVGQVGRGLYRKVDAALSDFDLLEAAQRAPRATFDIGRTEIPVDDATGIGLYNAARTIVDTYRLRNAVGSDVANEALRRWLRGGGQPAQLLAVARAFPRAMLALLHALDEQALEALTRVERQNAG